MFVVCVAASMLFFSGGCVFVVYVIFRVKAPKPVPDLFCCCFFPPPPSSLFHLFFKTYLIVEIAFVVARVFIVLRVFVFRTSGAGGDFFFFFIEKYFFIIYMSCVSSSPFLVCLLQDALGKAGALVLVVETLKVHQGHAGVAEMACAALANLARNNAANQVTSTGGKQDPVGGGGG